MTLVDCCGQSCRQVRAIILSRSGINYGDSRLICLKTSSNGAMHPCCPSRLAVGASASDKTSASWGLCPTVCFNGINMHNEASSIADTPPCQLQTWVFWGQAFLAGRQWGVHWPPETACQPGKRARQAVQGLAWLQGELSPAASPVWCLSLPPVVQTASVQARVRIVCVKGICNPYNRLHSQQHPRCRSTLIHQKLQCLHCWVTGMWYGAATCCSSCR